MFGLSKKERQSAKDKLIQDAVKEVAKEITAEFVKFNFTLMTSIDGFNKAIITTEKKIYSNTTAMQFFNEALINLSKSIEILNNRLSTVEQLVSATNIKLTNTKSN